MAESYRDFFVEFAPARWLTAPWGRAWHNATGIILDGLVDVAELAIRARSPTHAPDDALPYVGDNRQLDRGPDEPIHFYRARLRKPFTAWASADSDAGLLGALSALGLFGRIKHNADWNADGHPGHLARYWARLWIVLDPPSTAGFGPPATCGRGPLCGDGSLAGVSGVSATLIRALFFQLHKWKGSHAKLMAVLIPLGGALLCGDGHVARPAAMCGAGTVLSLSG